MEKVSNKDRLGANLNEVWYFNYLMSGTTICVSTRSFFIKEGKEAKQKNGS